MIEPVTVEQAPIARQAFHDFGKGRHAAGLNFGDCFAYALAKAAGEPLLFKGDDFRKRISLPPYDARRLKKDPPPTAAKWRQLDKTVREVRARCAGIPPDEKMIESKPGE